jgi:hypothetical protein
MWFERIVTDEEGMDRQLTGTTLTETCAEEYLPDSYSQIASD